MSEQKKVHKSIEMMSKAEKAVQELRDAGYNDLAVAIMEDVLVNEMDEIACVECGRRLNHEDRVNDIIGHFYVGLEEYLPREYYPEGVWYCPECYNEKFADDELRHAQHEIRRLKAQLKILRGQLESQKNDEWMNIQGLLYG